MSRHPEPTGATAPSADGNAAAATAIAPPPQTRPEAIPAPAEPPARRPRRRKALVASVLVLLLAGGGAGAYAVLSSRWSNSDSTVAVKAVTTAAVTRANLVDTEQDDGSLSYDDQQTLHAGNRGVLTALPDEGATVSRGQSLYRVDDKPVTLFYGNLPLYRTLQDGVDDGADVKQLEENLDALGYGDNLTVDDHFSSATTDAVKAWQADRGLDQTGTVDATQVVFLPHAVRVGQHKAGVGDSVNGGMAVATISATTRIATVDLAADNASIARVRDKVDIELPNGHTVKGTITEIAKVATTASTASGGSSGSASSSSSSSSDPTITVTIRVDDPRATGDLDQAPVKVDFTKQRKTGVLAVPVTALVALSEGGYAVEVSDGGAATHLVKVTTGLFASGQVEVAGAGLQRGQRVVVPE